MRIELITWIDSFGVSSSWQELGELNVEPVLCQSVGFVRESNEYIIVIPHYIKETKQTEANACGDMAIPKCCIKTRVILQEIS